MKLLEIVRDIKAESKDPDLRVQLDVFEEQKESDEGQVMCLFVTRTVPVKKVLPLIKEHSFSSDSRKYSFSYWLNFWSS